MKYKKYPRTLHLPFSPGSTNDDKFLKNVSCFEGKEVVVSLKMDGENTTLYNDHLHARSVSSNHHPSRSWIKEFHNKIKFDIPETYRICGENLFAKHSIFYDDLKSYFLAFSVWNNDTCLPWEETKEVCHFLNIQMVETIYEDIWDETKIKNSFKKYAEKNEGYVVRLKNSFNFVDFSKSTAKFVRKEFREQLNSKSIHWMTAKVVPNLLSLRDK